MKQSDCFTNTRRILLLLWRFTERRMQARVFGVIKPIVWQTSRISHNISVMIILKNVYSFQMYHLPKGTSKSFCWIVVASIMTNYHERKKSGLILLCFWVLLLCCCLNQSIKIVRLWELPINILRIVKKDCFIAAIQLIREAHIGLIRYILSTEQLNQSKRIWRR